MIGDGYRAKLGELGGDGPIFLRAGALTQDGFNWSGLDRFDSACPVAGKLGRPRDVVITTKGNSIGRVGYVPSDAPNFVYSPHLSFWRSLDQSNLVPRFLYYWSRSSKFAAQVRSMGFGTDMAPYLSLRDQLSLRIELPPASYQRAIATVLGALDDKISANTRVSQTARELASLQFEAIPAAERHSKKLGDVMNLKYGKALPASARTAGVATVVGSGGPVGTHEKGLVDGPCVVVGRKGSVGSTYWIPGPAFPIDTTFFVEPKKDVSLIYCYFLLKSLALAGMNSDSAVPGLNRGKALALPVMVPESTAMLDVSARAMSLFDLATQHDKESRTLAELRDTLLPALMSGRLRIKDAEHQVEDAV